MFGKKKKAVPRPTITIWDDGGNALYDGPLTGLRLTDETTVRLSIHFFNDPEPCEIHRSAVLSRVFTELEEALPANAAVGIDGSGVPADYFAAYPNARRVRLAIEQGASA